MAEGKQLCAGLLLAASVCLTPPAEALGAAGPVKAPNDPLFKYQWHLREVGAQAAWAVSRGRGATVAVLDSGVAYEDRGRYRRAPDLRGTRFARGWDFVDDDPHPDDEPPRERHSHGTHIAGIIAQTTGNRLGGAGLAPDATIMPVRVLEPDLSGSAGTIARGLRFAADHGADVVNLSLAGPKGSPLLERALAYARSKGVTVVASAGNGGQSSVSFPAAYRRVIAVGALSRDGSLAYYSNHGRSLDLVAPAGDREVLQTGVESGEGILQQTLKGGPATFCFCQMASTSAAAAQVSAVAALLIASGRARTPSEVEAALRSGARDLGRRGADPTYGAGVVQAAGALSAAVRPPGGEPGTATGPDSADGRTWYAWAGAALLAVALLTALGLSALRRRRPSRR